MDKDTVTGLIVENRQKKGLYGIKNVSQGVWRGFYPDGKIKDIPPPGFITKAGTIIILNWVKNGISV